MTNINQKQLVCNSLNYALDIVEYSDKLIEAKKSVIASKILDAGLDISGLIYLSLKSELKKEFDSNKQKAINKIKDTLYWIKQCSQCKSYPKDPYLEAKGLNLMENVSTLSMKR